MSSEIVNLPGTTYVHLNLNQQHEMRIYSLQREKEINNVSLTLTFYKLVWCTTITPLNKFDIRQFWHFLVKL